MKRWGTRLHAALCRFTRGRLLGRVGGQPVLLRAQLWLRLTAGNRYLDGAAQKAGRELPVVVLTPSP